MPGEADSGRNWLSSSDAASTTWRVRSVPSSIEKGEQEGEQGSVWVSSPWRASSSVSVRSLRMKRGHVDAPRQLQSALRVAEPSLSGGALCRPTMSTPSARRSIAVPWRERPRILGRLPAKPAASEVVAHATLSLSQPERSSSVACDPAAASKARGSAPCIHRPSRGRLCGSQLARSRRSALSRSARAARG